MKKDKELIKILNGAREDIIRQMEGIALEKAGSDYHLYNKLLTWRDKAVRKAQQDGYRKGYKAKEYRSEA